jgi:hypothetical protein
MAFVGLFLVPKPRETDEQLKLRMANVLAALLAKYCPIRTSPPVYNWPWLWGKKGAELVAIGIGCPGSCDKAQCGSVAVEYTYVDPVTKKKVKGTVTCPCAEKTCPDPLVCDQNKCDCPAGGVAVDMPCGETSLGGCSCVEFGSWGTPMVCRNGTCFDSGPCSAHLIIEDALAAYLASGHTLDEAKLQRWEVGFKVGPTGGKGYTLPCGGIDGAKAYLVKQCLDAAQLPAALYDITVWPAPGAPCN